MSKSDEDTILKVFLVLVGLGALTFVFWLIGSAIRFLSDNRFVYGLIIGVIVGVALTLGIEWLIAWWQSRKAK